MQLLKILSVLLVLSTPAFGVSKESVMLTQILLNKFGFNTGTPDGVYGNKTKNALESFYANRGKKFDGVLGENERSDLADALTNGLGSGAELSRSGYSLISIPRYSSGKKKYLGCWGCSSSNSDSICNLRGPHGSYSASDSIWNPQSSYGNNNSSESPWKETASSAPKLFDSSGAYQGKFSINELFGFKQAKKLKAIYYSVGGDLSKVRNAICK